MQNRTDLPDTLVWLYPDLEAHSTGGATGIRDWQPLAEDPTPLHVCGDGDPGGQKAARELRDRLGWSAVTMVWETGDSADKLQELLEERAAIVEHDGGLPRIEAEGAVWRSLIDRATHNKGEQTA